MSRELRPGSATGEPDVVDQIRGVLTSGPPKTYEVRAVPLPRFLIEAAGTHLGIHAEQLGRALGPDSWEFGGQDDPAEGLNRDSFRNWVVLPALRTAGLPEAVRAHDLCHTCGSLLIQLGAHPKAIEEVHGSPADPDQPMIA